MPNHCQGAGPFRRASFALHYFPSIPLEGAHGVQSPEPAAETFQRVELGRLGALAGGPAPRAGGRQPGLPPAAVPEGQENRQAEVEAAFRRGLEAGEQAGRAAALEGAAGVLRQFATVMEQFDTLAEGLRRDAERQAVSLALAVARKVVGEALATRPEALEGLIREALRRSADHGRIRLRVHPDHLVRVQQALPSFGEVVGRLERLSVEADVAVHGGCVLETDFGELDACLETQLQVVEELFRELGV